MKKNASTYLLLLMAIGLLVYTNLRAYHIGLTCDEASTYLSHVNRNLWTCFFSESCWSDANNHWLNTFLMQPSIAIFGVSEWSIRLPNLFGHLLYLCASIVLIKNISKNIWVALAGFCLLNFNPFLLEFFALARGYGLGIGCMMMSMTFFFLWIKNQKARWLVGSFFMAVLAVLSNFIFLNYLASLIAVLIWNLGFGFFQNKKQLNFKLLAIPMITSSVLFFILKTPIQTLRNKGEFVFGTDSLASTMYELVLDSVMAQGYLYPYTSDVFYYVSLLFLGIAVLVGVVVFLQLHSLSDYLPPKSPKWDFTTSVKVPLGGFSGQTMRGLNNKNHNHHFPKVYFAGVLLLLVLLAAFIVQYHLLDVKYLVDRKSVILIPLVSLPVYFLLENIYRNSNNRFARLILPIFFTLFFINHFERTSNLEKSVEWIYDAHTKEMIQYVKENFSENNPTTLGVFWIFGPASEFYRQQFSLEKNIQLTRIEDEELSTTQEFSHIYIAKHQEGILPKTYKIEKRFGTSGILYRSTKTKE